MKYRLLVLDHDDTVVNSTATIHYPCFVEYLRLYRPALADGYTLTSYFEKNFHPGITALLRDEVGLSAEQMKHEEAYWADYVKSHVPTAYEGMRELLERFRAQGGLIAINSHSFSSYILRDYEKNALPPPDAVYGWDLPPECRKPSPFAIEDAMRRFDVPAHEVLMVDDSKPGFDCARAAGVAFAAAGWAFDIPYIRDFMTAHCDVYLPTVASLSDLLFGV